MCTYLIFSIKKKRKEKMTPVHKYRHEYEPVGLTLITIFCDAMYGVMPPFLLYHISSTKFLARVH